MANIKALLKNTVDINKRYSNALFDLSREYVKALDRSVNELEEAPGQEADLLNSMEQSGSLLLAEEAGQIAKAAFPIHNSSTETMEINLILNCDDLPYLTELTPTSVELQPGQSTIIRLKSHITEAGNINTVYRGTIRVSEFDDYQLRFMVVKVK